MNGRIRSNNDETRKRVTTRSAGPAIFVTAVAAILLCGVLLFLSARQADRVAMERQRSLLQSTIVEAARDTAHEQEAVTVWDDAVRKIQVRDLPWIDSNLGIWMHSYYGHDEVLITELDGRPIYQMRAGHRVRVDPQGAIRRAAAPLIEQIHRALAKPLQNVGGTGITIGAIDLASVSGHPAVVSVKPIAWEKESGTKAGRIEYLHISVKYLDGPLLHRLGRQYQIANVGFSRAAPADGGVSIPLISRGGRRFGFLTWEPFKPGSLVVRGIAPVMVLALLLISILVVFLWRRARTGALKLEASEAQAQHLAFHDALTGLDNRNLFEEQTARELARARAEGRTIAYLYVDLDGFKQVNDTLGHHAGDDLLKAVADRLLDCVGITDLLGRLAGDEFAVLQLDLPDLAAAEALSQKIIESLSRPFSVGGARADIGASIGIALGPTETAEPSELARRADIALYEAKAAGRGCWRLFEPAMDASRRGRREIQEALRAALAAGDQFELHYQPVYAARSQRITGAEALLRWRHPERGMISPAMFVPIAEETTLIEPLGEWVLERALADFADVPGLMLAVNVSAVQLRNPAFADKLLRLLDAEKFDPRRLEIEITETSFIENAASCRPNLQKLRARGVRVALDDFGTGYSSFSHLSEFEVDRIKIDRSFVSSIGAGDQGVPIVRSIVSLAKARRLSITAEGVETIPQRDYLARIGCTALQGYLLARPMPFLRFLQLISAPRTAEPPTVFVGTAA
jgi:diguanylate cyclase (GGDEF)-like protein